MKVVLDANVIISFLLTRGETISSIFDYWDRNTFTILVSREIFTEINEVFERFVQKGTVNSRSAEGLLRKLERKAKEVKVVTKLTLSSDQKDNRYLECAKDGRADYLVSGDPHLLSLKRYKCTKIVSPKYFSELIKHLDYRLRS